MQTLPQPLEHIGTQTTVFTPPARREEGVSPMPLTEVEERILRSIYDLHYLTIAQIARLHYPNNTRATLNYVAAIMKQLDDEKDKHTGKHLHKNYVQRGFLGRAVQFGRNPSVFRLATNGMNHMADLGLWPLPKFRPSDPFPSYDNLKHTLCVNDVIIAASRLAAAYPEYRLQEVRHDWVLHHTPIYVPAEKKGAGKIAVIPDAWLDFYLPAPPGKTKQPRIPIHLELDRGTEDTAHSFKPRFAARIAYVNGPYEQAFHTPYVTIAYATTRGKYRMERMRTWAEEELTRLKQEGNASVFYFTALENTVDQETGAVSSDDITVDPETLFLKPVWSTPFDHTPKPLLAYD